MKKLSNKKEDEPKDGKNCPFYSKCAFLQVQVMFSRSNPIDSFQWFGQKVGKSQRQYVSKEV